MDNLDSFNSTLVKLRVTYFSFWSIFFSWWLSYNDGYFHQYNCCLFLNTWLFFKDCWLPITSALPFFLKPRLDYSSHLSLPVSLAVWPRQVTRFPQWEASKSIAGRLPRGRGQKASRHRASFPPPPAGVEHGCHPAPIALMATVPKRGWSNDLEGTCVPLLTPCSTSSLLTQNAPLRPFEGEIKTCTSLML